MHSPDIPLTPRKRVVSHNERESFLARVDAFLAAHKVAVLSVCSQDRPSSYLMGYARLPGEMALVIATADNTSKSRTLRSNGQVSLMVVNAATLSVELKQATALTVNGRACEITGENRHEPEELFAAENPALASFARSPDTVFFRIDIEHLMVVDNFQDITELHLSA